MALSWNPRTMMKNMLHNVAARCQNPGTFQGGMEGSMFAIPNLDGVVTRDILSPRDSDLCPTIKPPNALPDAFSADELRHTSHRQPRSAFVN